MTEESGPGNLSLKGTCTSRKQTWQRKIAMFKRSSSKGLFFSIIMLGFQLRQQILFTKPQLLNTMENCHHWKNGFSCWFYSNPTETGGFLTLHNLVCGVSTAALSRKTWLLQRGVLRLVSAAAAEQSLGTSSMGTAAAAAAAAARMRLETRVEKKWKRWE